MALLWDYIAFSFLSSIDNHIWTIYYSLNGLLLFYISLHVYLLPFSHLFCKFIFEINHNHLWNVLLLGNRFRMLHRIFIFLLWYQWDRYYRPIACLELLRLIWLFDILCLLSLSRFVCLHFHLKFERETFYFVSPQVEQVYQVSLLVIFQQQVV